jgi:spermidine synthase
MVQMYSSLFQTCRSVFCQVIVLPGINGTIVASDRNINTEISHLSEIKQFKSDYINYYINDPELRRRSVEVTKQLYPAPLNTDYNSLAVRGFYQSWAEMYGLNMRKVRLAGWILLTIVMVLIIWLPPATSAIFTAGMSSSALQVILILAFQVVYGQVLGMMGFLTAVFMGGLALGASFPKALNKKSPLRNLTVLLCLLSASALVLPLAVSLSAKMFPWPFWVGTLFTVFSVLLALITGRIFSYCISISGGNNISVIYGADMAGAASGAILVVIILIPLAGIGLSPLLTAIPGIWLAMSMTIRQKLKTR